MLWEQEDLGKFDALLWDLSVTLWYTTPTAQLLSVEHSFCKKYYVRQCRHGYKARGYEAEAKLKL